MHHLSIIIVLIGLCSPLAAQIKTQEQLLLEAAERFERLSRTEAQTETLRTPIVLRFDVPVNVRYVPSSSTIPK